MTYEQAKDFLFEGFLRGGVDKTGLIEYANNLKLSTQYTQSDAEYGMNQSELDDLKHYALKIAKEAD